MPEISFDLVGSFAALIFDCDGTLVSSNELHYRALNEVVGSQGIGMPRACCRSDRLFSTRDSAPI
jgi:beta-phosphoglucomutase-like phosphatase (HAD superfamily)